MICETRGFLDILVHPSPNIIRVIKSRRITWAEHVARRWRNLRERLKLRREDNIKMDLEEVGWNLDWIDLVQGRDRWRAVVKVVMNLRVP